MEELRLDHPPKMMHFLCVGCYIQDTPVNTQTRVYDLITAKQATDGSAPDGKNARNVATSTRSVMAPPPTDVVDDFKVLALCHC